MQSVSMTTLVNNHSDLGWLCAYCTEEKRQKIQCSTRGREQILIWIKRVTLPFFVSCYLNCSLDLFGFENIPGGTHQNVQLSESSSNHCVLKLTHLWSFKVLTVKYLSISKMAIRSWRILMTFGILWLVLQRHQQFDIFAFYWTILTVTGQMP